MIGDSVELGAKYDEKLAASSQPLRSNVLSNKVTSVLSTSYADGDIREALRILDGKRLQNTADTRRNLRLDAQKDVIKCNGDIINDFGKVAEQLERIGSTIASLNKCCEDMRRHVAASHQETAPVMAEGNTLLTQKHELETKDKVLGAFKQHFIISEDEMMALTSMMQPVDEQFFTTLTRLKRIHKDCRILLGSENQQLGLELMDQSSRSLNGAFQKLYRWIQKEFKSLDLENPQISSSIRRALRVLAERPTLFQSCLDFFANAREQILSNSFYSALNGSAQGEDLMTKPIDIFAHDPLRYVGDMLAWTHSATVSEREALEVLFVTEGKEIAKGIQEGVESEPWSKDSSDIFDGRKALEQLVNRDLGGVARALRQRVDQIVKSHDEPVLAYKISSLISFYRVTFIRLLGQDSSVLVTLSALEESALAQCRTALQDQVKSIQPEATEPPPDLGPPDFLDQALDQLKAIMKSYDSSLKPASSREADFAPILHEALDPFLDACTKMANALKEPSNSIFTINCLAASKITLAAYEFTRQRITQLEDTIETHASKLVDYQHAFFLQTSGLDPLVTALSKISSTEKKQKQEKQEDEDKDEEKEDAIKDPQKLKQIPHLPAFHPSSLQAISQTLDDFLPTALMDAMENLAQLKNSRLAAELTEEAADRYVENFVFVESWLVAVDEVLARDGEDDGEEGGEGGEEEEGEDGMGRLRSLFPRTSGEIRVLLS